MRILIYGAGAIGSYLGALLSEAGEDVTLVARGAQYEALSRDGLSITWVDGRTRQMRVKTCLPGAAGSGFDLVLVTQKSMQLAASARDLSATLAPGGALVMIQNGLPWWYFEGIDSPWRGTRLASLDPQGELARAIDLTQVIGAVIYKPVMVTAPGQLFIPAFKADRLVIGEVDNCITPRVRDIAALLTRAGMLGEVTDDIRLAKWTKLMSNLVWNPLSALTQSASGHIAALPGAAALVRDMMREGEAVARAAGVLITADIDGELARVKGNFAQQPSMMQDIRAGRALEIDAILNAVIEIADLAGVAVPALRHIAACVSLLDQRVREDGVAFAPQPVVRVAATVPSV